MQRFYLYLGIFLTFVIGYIFSGFNSRFDSIGSLIFIISSIFYVFSFEEMPNSNDDLQYTDTFYYFKSRSNNYGNRMMMALIGITLFFITLYFTFNVSLIISTLLSWLGMCVAIYIITKKNDQKLFIHLVADFISDKLPQIDNTKVIKLLETLESKNGKIILLKAEQVVELDYVMPFKSTLNGDLLLVIQIYLEFKASSFNKVISDEITALNEKHDRTTRTNT